MAQDNPKTSDSSELLRRLIHEVRTTVATMEALAPLMPVLLPAMTLLPTVWSASLEAVKALRQGVKPDEVAQTFVTSSEPLARETLTKAGDTVLRILLEDPKLKDLGIRLQDALVALSDNPRVAMALQHLQTRLMEATDRVIATMVDQAFEDNTYPIFLDASRVFEDVTQRVLTFAIDRSLSKQTPDHRVATKVASPT